MHKIFSIIIFILTSISSIAQNEKALYNSTFVELKAMLDGTKESDFKKAVFLVENSYLNSSLDYNSFCKTIDSYKKLCEQVINSRKVDYVESDYKKFAVQAAIFSVMTDSIPIQLQDDKIVYTKPFEYDFEDFAGSKNWTSMFVSKLLLTHKGNCHSLPYLHKIITEELGEESFLAYAPNHIYIKQHCKAYGWYNVELSSGMFPIDAWLMASGYIHLTAIQNGIYMSKLNQKESIASCMLDLAQGYQRKYGIENGEFILTACETVLKYYPNFINALLYQAETKMTLLKYDTNISKDETQKELLKIQDIYTKIHDLGYRKMPDEMYLDWLVSLKSNDNINYLNPKLKIKSK